MTTVIYHKGILAADSRRTSKSTQSAAVTYTCKTCGGDASERVIDTVEKIRSVSEANRSFRKDRILAISGAGNTQDIEHQIAAFRKVPNFERAFNESRYFFPKDAKCTLLLVGETRVFVLDITGSSNSPLKVTEHLRTDTVCIGSGGMAARTALVIFKQSIFNALAVAAEVDDATGGRITYVNLLKDPCVVRAKAFPNIVIYDPKAGTPIKEDM